MVTDTASVQRESGGRPTNYIHILHSTRYHFIYTLNQIVACSQIPICVCILHTHTVVHKTGSHLVTDHLQGAESVQGQLGAACVDGQLGMQQTKTERHQTP